MARFERSGWKTIILSLKQIDRLRVFSLNKRQRFILASALVTVGVTITQLLPDDWRVMGIVLLGVWCWLVSIWALREDLGRLEYFTLLFLPTAFTVATAMAYFLLPVRWLTRIPVIIFFSVSFYSLLLTENIFNVAAIRTIQLLRAAHTVGYLFTLVTAFLFFDVLFAFHLSPWLISVAVSVILFPLVLSHLWSLQLGSGFSLTQILYSAVISLAVGELAWAISFWPLRVLVPSLFLVTCLYAFLGIAQHYLQLRLTRRTAVEYILVGMAVFLIMALSTKWGGGG